jgi:hypothetical protein
MTHTDEDDEFDRILRENRLRVQAYHFPEQPKWTELTDAEISEAATKSQSGISPHNDTLRFARAIEAKLKEKNT